MAVRTEVYLRLSKEEARTNEEVLSEIAPDVIKMEVQRQAALRSLDAAPAAELRKSTQDLKILIAMLGEPMSRADLSFVRGRLTERSPLKDQDLPDEVADALVQLVGTEEVSEQHVPSRPPAERLSIRQELVRVVASKLGVSTPLGVSKAGQTSAPKQSQALRLEVWAPKRESRSLRSLGKLLWWLQWTLGTWLVAVFTAANGQKYYLKVGRWTDKGKLCTLRKARRLRRFNITSAVVGPILVVAGIVLALVFLVPRSSGPAISTNTGRPAMTSSIAASGSVVSQKATASRAPAAQTKNSLPHATGHLTANYTLSRSILHLFLGLRLVLVPIGAVAILFGVAEMARSRKGAMRGGAKTVCIGIVSILAAFFLPQLFSAFSALVQT